jgi:hypothetical protein
LGASSIGIIEPVKEKNMEDSNKWWAVLFIAIICVFLGVHAVLDVNEIRGGIYERLDAIEEALVKVNETLAEQQRTLPSDGVKQAMERASIAHSHATPSAIVQKEAMPSREASAVRHEATNEREGTLLPLPSDEINDSTEQVIQELGNIDTRIEEFRGSMSKEEREILENMKEQAFHAAVGGAELVDSLTDEEVATLKSRLLADSQMAAYFIVVEEKILRQMVIDKALNGLSSPFSIEAEKPE